MTRTAEPSSAGGRTSPSRASIACSPSSPDRSTETGAEIESITGEPAPDRLTPAEQRFVLTQIEPVD